MKKLTYLTAALCFTVTSCKKPWGNSPSPPAPVYFEIIGKDGNNIVRAVKDSLVVTYVESGVTETHRLTIYKVQVSATDTTAVTKYNGFVISDRNYTIPGNLGYISAASAGSTRDFNLTLNGISIGTLHLNYREWLSSYPHQSSPAFAFNGLPGKSGTLAGVYNNGDGIAHDIEYYTDLPGNYITVLQME